MHKNIAFAGVIALLATALPSEASAWDLIGTKNVTDKVDFDLVHAPGPKLYKEIRLCVARNPVRFHDVDVRFANFGRQDIKLAQRIEPGKCTRVIDLRGAKRNIVYIKFLYEETSPKQRTATVRIFAR